MDAGLHDDRSPTIPLGNLEPYTLAGFLYDDSATAWNAMAKCSGEPSVGGNLMFARQAFAYLELACRTASTHETGWYLENLSGRLAECDARYFTRLPGPVPLPHAEDFRLPAAVGHAPELQLLAALFDTARHGLAQLSQQIPVRLTDDKAVPRRASEGRSHSREGPDEEKQGKVGRRPLDKASIREQAIWDKGMLATQNTVVGLQDASTRERLIEDFELDEDEDSLGRS